ncbi:MAG: hypothetical protein ACKO37_03650 [Vampirovibrionales bacterium]
MRHALLRIEDAGQALTTHAQRGTWVDPTQKALKAQAKKLLAPLRVAPNHPAKPSQPSKAFNPWDVGEQIQKASQAIGDTLHQVGVQTVTDQVKHHVDTAVMPRVTPSIKRLTRPEKTKPLLNHLLTSTLAYLKTPTVPPPTPMLHRVLTRLTPETTSQVTQTLATQGAKVLEAGGGHAPKVVKQLAESLIPETTSTLMGHLHLNNLPQLVQMAQHNPTALLAMFKASNSPIANRMSSRLQSLLVEGTKLDAQTLTKEMIAAGLDGNVLREVPALQQLLKHHLASAASQAPQKGLQGLAYRFVGQPLHQEVSQKLPDAMAYSLQKHRHPIAQHVAESFFPSQGT